MITMATKSSYILNILNIIENYFLLKSSGIRHHPLTFLEVGLTTMNLNTTKRITRQLAFHETFLFMNKIDVTLHVFFCFAAVRTSTQRWFISRMFSAAK